MDQTIILMNDEATFAKFYTRKPRFLRRLMALAAKYPERCRLIDTGRDGSRQYLVDWELLSVIVRR